MTMENIHPPQKLVVALDIGTTKVCAIAGYRNEYDNIEVVGVVAETDEVLLGDVDLNGTVDFFDIAPFIAVLADSGDQAEADVDQSGIVDFFDIAPFIAILAGSGS